MKEALTCANCGIELSSNLKGKAEARDWDESRLSCVDCSDSFDAPRICPKA